MKLIDALPRIMPPKPGSDLEKLFKSRDYVIPAEGRPCRIAATRRTARAVLEAHPEPPPIIDFEGIEVASTPFLSELRKAWPDAQPENMNEDVKEAWDYLTERWSQ